MVAQAFRDHVAHAFGKGIQYVLHRAAIRANQLGDVAQHSDALATYDVGGACLFVFIEDAVERHVVLGGVPCVSLLLRYAPRSYHELDSPLPDGVEVIEDSFGLGGVVEDALGFGHLLPGHGYLEALLLQPVQAVAFQQGAEERHGFFGVHTVGFTKVNDLGKHTDYGLFLFGDFHQTIFVNLDTALVQEGLGELGMVVGLAQQHLIVEVAERIAHTL